MLLAGEEAAQAGAGAHPQRGGSHADVARKRVGERGEHRSLAELLGEYHHQVVAGEVALKEGGQLGHFGLIRHRLRPGAYHHEEVVVENLAGQHHEVVPAVGRTKFAPYAVVLCIQHAADKGLYGIGAAEYYPAAHLAREAGKGAHPAAEACFILGVGRHPHEYARYGVGRYETAGYNHHLVCGAEKLLHLVAEERVDYGSTAVQ